MSIPGPLLPHRVKWGAGMDKGTELSILQRPLHPWEETGPVRTDQEVQMKHFPWFTQGTTYLTVSNMRWASSARGGFLGDKTPLCQQAGAARGWTSKTILGPKGPFSKTIQKQDLDCK